MQDVTNRKVSMRLNAANAVIQVCKDHPTAVALVPAFSEKYTKLVSDHTKADDLAKMLSRNGLGAGRGKIALKKDLAANLAMLCGAGFNYAESIKDTVLATAFDYNASTLHQLKDNDFINKAEVLVALQVEHAPGLLPGGIDTAFMTELNDMLDQYSDVSPIPIANRATNKSLREELEKQAFALFRFVLDDMGKAARIYIKKDMVFYQAFKNAARLNNVGIRHEDPPLAAKNATDAPASETPAARKTVQLAPSMPGIPAEPVSQPGNGVAA